MAKVLFDGKEAGQLIAGKTLQFQTKEGLTATVFGQDFDVIITDKGRDDALALRSEGGKIEIVEEPEGSQNGKKEEKPNEAGDAGSGEPAGGEPAGSPASGVSDDSGAGVPAGSPSGDAGKSGDGATGQSDPAGQPAGKEEPGKGGEPASSAQDRKFTVEQ